MNEPRVVESVTNECQSLGREHESSSARAEQLISCLEGEIAKRDARIVELESDLAGTQSRVLSLQDQWRKLDAELAALKAQYQRDVWGLNNEGDPIGGDPAGGYANDNARLRAELAALKAQEPAAWAGVIEDCASLFVTKPQLWKAIPLYAAPVSEAKAEAQDTVGEVVGWYRLDRPYEMTPYPSVCATWHRLGAPVAPLYAAPVQQVSVPQCFTKLLHHAHGMTFGADWNKGTMAGYHREPLGKAVVQCQAWLAAAPAAPAADAGLVEALEMALEIGDGCSRGFLGKFQAKARAAIAAHRAKGVA